MRCICQVLPKHGNFTNVEGMKVLELVLKSKNSNNLAVNKQLVQALFSYVCQTLEIEVINIALERDCLVLWFKLLNGQEQKLIVDSIVNISNRVIGDGLNLVENFWEEKYILNEFMSLGNQENSKKAKCLVTGGAGFIGSNLVDGLIEQGYQVVVVDNLSTGKREYLNPQAKFYETDILDQKKLQAIFEAENFDYVFHLAAQISVADSVKDPAYDNLVNAQGSYNVFERARLSDIKKIIFVSTGGALYGDVTEPAHENMAVKPTSPYAIHKYTAENYLEFFRNEYNLDSITLRLANVYGPRQFKGGEGAAVAVFTHNAIFDLPSNIYGDGTKTRDFVYVGDVVRACLISITSDYRGMVNIGTGEKISILDLIKTIEKANNKKIQYTHTLDRPGEVQDSILDIKRAKEVLGWQPVFTLEEGLRKTLEWSKIQTS